MLDGYPMTRSQIDLMTEHCIIPVRVIELDLESKECLIRGVRDRLNVPRLVSLQRQYALF